MLEAITSKLRRQGRSEETRPQGSVTIAPVTGETKTVLEEGCRIILQKDRLTSDDVYLLSKAMVWLLGGTQNEDGDLGSNPLIDYQRPATIRFRVHARNMYSFGGAISYDKGRRESFTYDAFGDFIHVSTIVNPKLYKYPSYFEGEKVSLFSEHDKEESIPHISGGPTSARPFFQKAFEVYQASQQPAQ